MSRPTDDTVWPEVQDAVWDVLEQDRTKSNARRTCRDLGLASDWDDLRCDTLSSIWVSYQRNPGLAKEILGMSCQELHAYVRAVTRNAAISLLRKRQAELRRRRGRVAAGVGPGADDAMSGGVPTSLERRDARYIMSKVNAMLDVEGKFTLLVIRSGKTPEAFGQGVGISESSGRRWFRIGVRMLREAVQQILGQEFGDQAMVEFIRLVLIYLQTEPDDLAGNEEGIERG